MAKERLEASGMESFVLSDDAGGMHPQLQRPHGVKLIVLEREADRARDMLREAGLLPSEAEAHESPGNAVEAPSPSASADSADLTFSMDRSVFSATGIAYLVVFVLMVGGILVGLAL